MESANLTFVPDAVGVTVVLDGHPQSHVCLDDPGLLAFEYVAQLALVLDTLPPGRVAVTHVGGGGLTVPRYVQHTRPGSPQIVLEPDAALTAAVRERLPLPRGHRIRVRATDGRTGLRALADRSADAIVLDAYAAGRVPADLVTVEFLADARRVLRPGGVLAANVADEPGLRYAARVLAGFAAAGWRHRALIATREVLKGRRFGNCVLVAGDDRFDAAPLERACARSSLPAGIRTGAGLERLVAGARPLTDDDGEASPAPPALDRWRIR
ncbi:MAG: fused MFS/spermidine synthase [Dermatophilaceae bacterium]